MLPELGENVIVLPLSLHRLFLALPPLLQPKKLTSPSPPPPSLATHPVPVDTEAEESIWKLAYRFETWKLAFPTLAKFIQRSYFHDVGKSFTLIELPTSLYAALRLWIPATLHMFLIGLSQKKNRNFYISDLYFLLLKTFKMSQLDLFWTESGSSRFFPPEVGLSAHPLVLLFFITVPPASVDNKLQGQQ